MSLYQLHRCVFDYMRAGEVSSGQAPSFDVSRYDLTGEERETFEAADIAALYRMGLHPVLLNGFCRAQGYSRNDYRAILEGLGTAETTVGRWHNEDAENRT